MNWDATQFKIGGDTSYSVDVIKWIHDGNGDLPTTYQSQGTTDLFIKLYHFHMAAGMAANPVYCVAVASMGPEDLIVRRIQGLGSHNNADNCGWIVFTKTRSCNTAFYRWFYEHIVVPFVVLCRFNYKCAYANGDPMHAFVYCDGESKQIEVFQNPEIISSMQTNLILLGKTPASCSGILQSSDVSPFFRDCKQFLRSICDKNWQNQQVKINMKALFEDLEIDALRIPPAHILKIKVGLEQVTFMMKDRMKIDHIQRGYSDTGQWLHALEADENIGNNFSLQPSAEGGYKNFHQTMTKCTAINGERLTILQYNAFEDALIPAINLYKINGCLTEENMNDLQLVNTTEGRIMKDARPLHQQRAVLMNSATTVAWYQHYITTRNERRVAIHQNRDTKAQKKAVVAIVTAAAREYKNWFDALPTKESKQAERKSKKEAMLPYKQRGMALPISYYREAINNLPHPQPVFEENQLDDVDDDDMDDGMQGSVDESDENESDLEQELAEFLEAEDDL
jgi:hypothetical protein